MDSSIPQKNTVTQSANLYLKIITAVVGAHIIVTFGEEITFFQAIINPRYYKAMAGSVLIAALVVEYIWFVNRKLDKRYNWLHQPVHRALMQLCVGVGGTGIIAFLLAFLYFRIRGVDILNTLYLRFDFAVIMLLILVMNMVFVLHFFYTQLTSKAIVHAAPVGAVPVSIAVVDTAPVDTAAVDAAPVDIAAVATESHSAPVHKEPFPVYSAGNIIQLPQETICCFFLDGDHRYVSTFDREKYLVSQTLDQIEQVVDPKLFFRANRQVLLSLHAYKHYTVLAFGKLLLTTDPVFKEKIIVSQKRARALKDWKNG